MADPWAAGLPYERFMGRWSRLVARQFVDWMAAPAGLDWLDVGSGTGALSEAILARANPASVRAVDSSEGFVTFLRASLGDRRLSVGVGDALALPVEPASVDVAASGLMLNFVTDPAAALRAMQRVLRPGGKLAFYVWDYGGRMDMLRHFWASVTARDPAARSADEAVRFPLCRPEALAQIARSAGLRLAEVAGLEIAMTFTSFEDYWLPFLGGQGPAPAYVATLGPVDRHALAEDVRRRLPFSADGSLHMTARAWAVRADL